MIPDTPFIPGLELSGRFYEDAVRPLLEAHFPGLPHSAARIDSGSDVFGFDTPRSMDHGWGARLTLYLFEPVFDRHGEAIRRMLSGELPIEFAGFPTHFEGESISLGGMAKVESGPVRHGVEIVTVRSFFRDYLGIDLETEIGVIDWLLLSEQRLRTVACGRVYHDGLGTLEPVRERFRWYPHDVWLYLMAAQWQRIDQEEPFMGRCGEVGDEMGSRLLASRRVHDLMRLGFLMERVYPPYSKWFGTAFARLACAERLLPLFDAVWQGRDWKEWEAALSAAYETVAAMHNALGITEQLATDLSYFHTRPYRVLGSGRFVEALRAAITDEAVLRLPPHLGSINQVTDMTDVLERNEVIASFRAVYEAG